jgi:tRNA-dihydrouridine synthase A
VEDRSIGDIRDDESAELARLIRHMRTEAWEVGRTQRAPLRYDDVHRLKADFPTLCIEINGGITTLPQATTHLQYVDGAMLGRIAYDHPYLFAEADTLYFGDVAPPRSRRQVLEAMLAYLECCMAQGLPPYRIVRHLLNLFAYQRAARLWKRYLSECTWAPETAMAALREAMSLVPDAVLDAHPQAAEHALPTPLRLSVSTPR